MVRWRNFLILALLLLLPARTGSEEDEGEDNEDDDNNNEDVDESDEETEKAPEAPRRPALLPTQPPPAATRTVPHAAARRPLECFACTYRGDSQLRSCLDPVKFRVHTMTCHNVDDKCFTSVSSKGNKYEAVVRGCRSSCEGTPETTCCELNRCNNQVLALPMVAPRTLTASKATSTIPPTVLFFVTILLVLQTVVKVAVV